MNAGRLGPWRPGEVILDLYEVQPVEEDGMQRDAHRGGMGLVYRVRHLGWNVDLAVKVPRRELLADEDQRARFEQEAEHWMRLGLHPNIVPCHYVRRLEGVPCVFSDYVVGGSLAGWVDQRRLYGGEKGLARVLDVGIQVARGLDHAHRLGVVHQDVNPANILVDSDASVRVADFGLAGATAGGNGPTLARTLRYASPEQMGARDPLTRATDAWGWAVTLLELFCGGARWETAALFARGALEACRTSGGPIPLPTPVADLIERCLEPFPDERPHDLGALARELEAIYPQCTGAPYARAQPEPAALLADAWSNRALSMLDLGRPDEAESAWAEALRADPLHPHATYNQGVHHWRAGQITDDELVVRLEIVGRSHADSWIDECTLGLVHLERGDAAAAEAVLKKAARRAPANVEVAAALARVGRTRATAPRALGAVIRPKARADVWHTFSATPDCRLAVTASGPRIELWDLRAGTRLRTLTGHTKTVLALALTPDGRLALSGSRDHSLRLWDLERGECLRIMGRRPDFDPQCVAISPDGRWAAAASGIDVERWDLTTGTALRHCSFGHAGDVTSVSWLDDGELLSTHRFGAVRLLDFGGASRDKDLAGYSESIHAVAAAWPLALSADYRGEIRLWDLRTGDCLRIMHGFVTSLALASDGSIAVSGGDRVRLWELETGSCRRTLPEHPSGASGVVLAPDGSTAVVGGPDGIVRLSLGDRRRSRSPWSFARPGVVERMVDIERAVAHARAEADRLRRAGRFPDAAVILAGARKRPGWRRHPDLLAAWRQLGRHGRRGALADAWPGATLTGGVNKLALTPNGRHALVAVRNTLQLWDVDSGRCLRTIKADDEANAIGCVAVSSDGRTAVSERGGVLSMWEVESGECVNELNSRAAYVAVSAGVISRGGYAAWRRWEAGTGECLRVLRDDRVDALAATPDAHLALCIGHEITLWDLFAGERLRTLYSGNGARLFGCAAITPDGHLGLTGHPNGTVIVWDLLAGTSIRVLERHDGRVEGVSVASDGRVCASAGAEGTVRLWDVATGACLRVFEGAGKPVALTPDACRLIAGRKLRVWDLDWAFEYRERTAWDDGVVPFLYSFLRDPDQPLTALQAHLEDVGYGWLDTAAVRSELERLHRSHAGMSAIRAQFGPPHPRPSARPVRERPRDAERDRRQRRAERFPIGATLADGAFEVGERLFGERAAGIYRGRAKSGESVLITVTAEQVLTYAELFAQLELPVDGFGTLRHVGRVEGDTFGAVYDGMVEDEPEGAPLSHVELPLPPATVRELMLQIAVVLRRADAAGYLPPALQPELIYTVWDGADVERVTVLPCRWRALAATAERADYVIRPMFRNRYDAAEVLNGAGATAAAGVFSLCMMAAHWLTGEHPFADDSPNSLTFAISSGKRRPWNGPDQLRPLLERGLEAAPGRRITLDVLIDELRSDGRAVA